MNPAAAMPSLQDPGRWLELKPLLREAADWRLISLLLERPRDAWRSEVEALATETLDTGLRAAIAGALRAAEENYLALVGPGAPVSLRTTAHRKTSDPGHVLAELQAMYDAFGYAPRREESIDHASVVAGFVAYLRLKEAAARADESSALADLARDVAHTVSREQLALLAEPVCDALFRLEAGYLALAAQALLERVGRRPADVEGGWTPETFVPGLAEEDVICG